MVQDMQIYKYSTTYKQNQGKVSQIITINAEKAYNKTQHFLMIKSLRKLGIEGSYLSMIKAILQRCIAKIILNREKLKAFPLKSRVFHYQHSYSIQYLKS
jgi:hypothetical protein